MPKADRRKPEPLTMAVGKTTPTWRVAKLNYRQSSQNGFIHFPTIDPAKPNSFHPRLRDDFFEQNAWFVVTTKSASELTWGVPADGATSEMR